MQLTVFRLNWVCDHWFTPCNMPWGTIYITSCQNGSHKTYGCYYGVKKGVFSIRRGKKERGPFFPTFLSARAGMSSLVMEKVWGSGGIDSICVSTHSTNGMYICSEKNKLNKVPSEIWGKKNLVCVYVQRVCIQVSLSLHMCECVYVCHRDTLTHLTHSDFGWANLTPTSCTFLTRLGGW